MAVAAGVSPCDFGNCQVRVLVPELLGHKVNSHLKAPAFEMSYSPFKRQFGEQRYSGHVVAGATEEDNAEGGSP